MKLDLNEPNNISGIVTDPTERTDTIVWPRQLRV